MPLTKAEARAACEGELKGKALGKLLGFVDFKLSDEELTAASVRASHGNDAVVEYLSDLMAEREAAAAEERQRSGAAAGTSGAAEYALLRKMDDVQEALSTTNATLATLTTTNKKMRAAIKQSHKAIIIASKAVDRLGHKPSTYSVSSSVYRPSAFEAYTHEKQPSMATCPVAAVKVDATKLIAGHVYQQSWDGEALHSMGVELHSPQNILLMLKDVEKRLDQFRITFMPEGNEFKLVVLDQKLLQPGSDVMYQDVDARVVVTWTERNGQPLVFSTDARPSVAVCSFHARHAIKYAEDQGWIPVGSIARPATQLYDADLMARFVTDANSNNSSNGNGGDANSGSGDGDGGHDSVGDGDGGNDDDGGDSSNVVGDDNSNVVGGMMMAATRSASNLSYAPLT